MDDRLCAHWKRAACVALFLLRILGMVQESSGNCCQRAAVHYFKRWPGIELSVEPFNCIPKKTTNSVF